MTYVVVDSGVAYMGMGICRYTCGRMGRGLDWVVG